MFNLKKKMRKARKGFTLVELIIVIAILGILAAIAVPTFGGIQAKAKVKAEIASAKTVLQEARIAQTEAGDDVEITTVAGLSSLPSPTLTRGAGDDGKYSVSWTSNGTQDAVNAVDGEAISGFTGANAKLCTLTEQ